MKVISHSRLAGVHIWSPHLGCSFGMCTFGACGIQLLPLLMGAVEFDNHRLF